MATSSAPQEIFVLRATLTSPFGRKVRLAADVLGLAERVRVVHADVNDQNDSLRRQNPLGKMPCLVREDGSAIFDSSVIVEFLQWVSGTERLFPAAGAQRFVQLTRAKLADGIMDAGAAIIYEGRWHDEAKASEPWREYQRGKIRRALASFEADPPDAARSDGVAIGLACALEFLERRQPLDWQAACPRLCAWLADFARHEPGYARIKAGDA